MFATLSHILTAMLDVLVVPFGDHRDAALLGVSLVSGVLLIFLFKAVSDQERVRRARDRVSARILEIRLYQDDPILVLRALGGVMTGNLGYLRSAFKPIVILAVVAIAFYIQLDARYGRGPLDPGQHTVVGVTLGEGLDVNSVGVRARVDGGGATIDAPPVRVAAEGAVYFRVRIGGPGDPVLALSAMDTEVRVPLVTTRSNAPIGHHRRARSGSDVLLHPGLAELPKDSPIAAIDVDYPRVQYSVLGWHTHWIVVFLIGSMVGALIPKFLFGIEI